MPIDTRFPTWMLPQSSPMDALFKGVAAGSQIAANRYRNKALYASVQQHQQQQDLQERELMAQNESRTLENEVRRTKLDHDAEDFNVMRAWWPKYAAANGEELAALEPPTLHDKDRQQTVSTAITAKFLKEKQIDIAKGSAAFGKLMSDPKKDITTPEVQAEIWGMTVQYPFLAAQMDDISRTIQQRMVLKEKKYEADNAVLLKNRQLDQAAERIDIAYQTADTRVLSVEQRREAAALANEARLARIDPNNEFNSARIELMHARAAKLSEEITKAPILNTGDKAKVAALSKSLKDANTEYYEASNEKAKAKAQAKITDIEAKLEKFNLPSAPPSTPPAPAAADTGLPHGPPASKDYSGYGPPMQDGSNRIWRLKPGGNPKKQEDYEEAE